MIQLYTTFLFQPLLNLLVIFYNAIGDIGVAIILLTVVIKLILYPFSRQALRSQRAMQRLQPKINELKARYKNEKEKMAQEMMQLYKNEKVHPLSSCLPLLVQLPFFLAVYQVFIRGLDSSRLELLYPFVANPGSLNTISLGLLNLHEPSWILAALAGAAQYWQASMLVTQRPPKSLPGAKDEDMAAIMNKQMKYLMPAVTVFIGLQLPAGLALYWFVMTLLTALQQLITFRADDAKNQKVQPQA